MRYFKTTFMWVIVLAALGGYIYMDFESTRIAEKKKDEATRLFPFYPKDVLAIILNKEQSHIELERWDDGWRIVAPIKAKADSKAVEKFLGYVTDSRNDADYVMDPDPKPERLLEFGLAKPTVKVTFKIGKDLKPYTMEFGDRAPAMGVAFARVEGKKPVYRVLSYVRGEANKDMYYFRDKTVLRLNPVKIDQMTIRRPEVLIRAKLPPDGKWALEKPIEARADHNKVFELFGAFANAEVKEFISENKKHLERYGLDKPQAELLLWKSGDSEPTVSIKIGDRSPKKRGYYCIMSDRDAIMLLEEDVVHAIPRQAKEIRSRRLFYFDKDTLKRIEIRADGRETVLVKDIEKEWRRNNVSGEKLDFNLVKSFLDDMMSFEIKDFITDNPGDMKEYGLNPPAMQALMWPEGSATPISLSIGRKAPSGYVYAYTGLERTVLALDESVERLLKTKL